MCSSSRFFTIAEHAGHGRAIIAVHDFRSTPQLDIICVPGGPGIRKAAAHQNGIAFLQDQAVGRNG
ncbi:MAG: hypothetical protein WA441_13120 [Methyloceanibacter sp.]